MFMNPKSDSVNVFIILIYNKAHRRNLMIGHNRHGPHWVTRIANNETVWYQVNISLFTDLYKIVRLSSFWVSLFSFTAYQKVHFFIERSKDDKVKLGRERMIGLWKNDSKLRQWNIEKIRDSKIKIHIPSAMRGSVLRLRK